MLMGKYSGVIHLVILQFLAMIMSQIVEAPWEILTFYMIALVLFLTVVIDIVLVTLHKRKHSGNSNTRRITD